MLIRHNRDALVAGMHGFELRKPPATAADVIGMIFAAVHESAFGT
jgi:hypothetical protein